MKGTDQSTRRAVVVIVLLVVVASALRGYLPGRGQVAREQPVSDPLATFAVMLVLAVAVAVLALAILVRLRDRRATAASMAPLPESAGTGAARSTWRFLLITAGVIIVWLLLNMLLAQLGPLLGMDQATPGPHPTPQGGSGGTAPPRAPAPAPQDNGRLLGFLAGATAITVLLVAAGAISGSRSRPRGSKIYAYTTGVAGDTAAPAAAAESLARAAELGLAEIGDFSREPREAIIACYAAMERELMHVPSAAPQDCDTPTEVLARAVEHHAVHAQSATQLVELFEEARFSPHVMNEGHRDVAVQTLQLVLAELRSAA